jgi:hypothetical protein
MSLLHYQMIIDVVFFVTVLVLLHRLSRKIAARPPAVDLQAMHEFKRVLSESKDATDQFLTALADNVRVLGKMIQQLNDREKALVMLLAEADESTGRLEIGKTGPAGVTPADRYGDVARMVQQGLGREEVAQRSGFTEGEIDLVKDLVLARKGPTVTK